MAETKLIRGMEMHLPGSQTLLNYNIPIVYYCVCNTAEDTATKVAKWYGILQDNGTEKNVKAKAITDGDKFRLYQGVTVAVYFTEGCKDIANIRLKIDDQESKPIVLNDSNEIDPLYDDNTRLKSKFGGCNKGDVMVFVYDGSKYKVANGIDSGALNLIKDKVVGLEKWTVKRPGYNPDQSVENQTGTLKGAGTDGITLIYVDNQGVVQESKKGIGNDKQFTYLANGKVTATTATVGSSTSPIWMNGGTLATLSAIGNVSTPVYVNSNGSITKIGGGRTIGEQGLAHMQPIYVSTSGALTAANITLGDGTPTATEPQAIWMDEGKLKEIQSSAGTDVKPLKLDNGIFKPVNNDLATQESVNNTAHKISIARNADKEIYTFKLLNADNTVISSDEIDLPLESMVVNIEYENGQIRLKLKNGEYTDWIDVAGITDGLVKDPSPNGAGSENNPIFVNDKGEATPMSQTIGNPNKPIYFDEGKIKECNDFPVADIGNGQITIKWEKGTPTNSLASFYVNQKTNATITFNIPSASSHLSDSENLIKRSSTSSVGSSTQPIFINQQGYVQAGATIPSYNRVSIDGDGLAPKAPGGTDKFLRGDGTWATIPASPDTNYYHTGIKTPAATDATTGLKATWDTVGTPGALGITIPIYWGDQPPTMGAVTGALYIKI